MLKHLLLTATFIIGPTLHAKELATLDRGDFWLLGGELMYLDKTGTETPEVDNAGLGYGFKGVFSRYWDKWVGDIGLGYRYDNMDAEDPSVETKAFWAELGFRYKINQAWSIGPELHLLMGQDVSFSDIGTNSDDKSSSLFLGFRVMHNRYIGKRGHILRLGGQVLTDLNIDERQVNYLQFIVEYGWPTGEQKKPVKKKKKKKQKKRKKRVKKRPKLKLDLRNAGVRFDSGKATLKGDSLMVIDRLSRVLKKYEKEWDEVRIEGHTDITGNYNKNVELSKARAATVENELVERGVLEHRIGSTGYGPDRPLDPARTKEAYAKNRRVELHLSGDRASAEFIRDLKRALRIQEP